MTFEEFFIKKKIDLGLLKLKLPALYDEFHLHFSLMGEKSFDHTKKYWFNQLRKDFLLHNDPESIVQKTEIITSKPTPSIPETPSVNPAVSKPAGFKPRFKAGVTAPKPSEDVVSEPTKEESIPVQETSDNQTSTEETPAVTPKPVGFKPRFKAGITAPKPSEDVVSEPTKEESKPVQEISEKESTQADTPPAAVKPTGFKPRFKAGITNIKKDPPEEKGD